MEVRKAERLINVGGDLRMPILEKKMLRLLRKKSCRRQFN